MIIWGWGRRTTTDYGMSRSYTCNNCRNVNRFRLLGVKKWFTLFFIPVFPYETSCLELCPICRAGRKLQKQELEALKLEAMNDQSYISGSVPQSIPAPPIQSANPNQATDPNQV